MVSPWLPRVIASTLEVGTPSWSATFCLNRAVSSMPAWPTTRPLGNPVTLEVSAVISSSGLDTTTMTALGENFATFSATLRTILALVSIRSMRLMPGLRASPAVMTTTSESAVRSYPEPSMPVVMPTTLVSKPSIDRLWLMSSAMPSGLPSRMSVISTSSKMSNSASRCAVVEP